MSWSLSLLESFTQTMMGVISYVPGGQIDNRI